MVGSFVLPSLGELLDIRLQNIRRHCEVNIFETNPLRLDREEAIVNFSGKAAPKMSACVIVLGIRRMVGKYSMPRARFTILDGSVTCILHSVDGFASGARSWRGKPTDCDCCLPQCPSTRGGLAAEKQTFSSSSSGPFSPSTMEHPECSLCLPRLRVQPSASPRVSVYHPTCFRAVASPHRRSKDTLESQS